MRAITIGVLLMELYDASNGWVFAVAYDYHNAWGWHCVAGTMFDTVTGTVYPNKLATGPAWASVSNIVGAAGRMAQRV